MTKRCYGCDKLKTSSAFHKNIRRADGLQSSCKICSAARRKAYWKNGENREATYQRVKKRRVMLAEKVYAILVVSACVDCGLADPEVLEFDHVRGKKRCEVGRMVSRGFAWETIQAEIDKCEIRCAHCHRKRTIKTLGWRKTFCPSSSNS